MYSFWTLCLMICWWWFFFKHEWSLCLFAIHAPSLRDVCLLEIWFSCLKEAQKQTCEFCIASNLFANKIDVLDIFQFFANQKLGKFLHFQNFGGGRIKPTNFEQNFTDWLIRRSQTYLALKRKRKISRELLRKNGSFFPADLDACTTCNIERIFPMQFCSNIPCITWHLDDWKESFVLAKFGSFNSRGKESRWSSLVEIYCIQGTPCYAYLK